MKADFPSFYEQYNLQSLTVEDINYIISRSAEFKARIREELGKAWEHGNHWNTTLSDKETYINSTIDKLFKQ